MTYPQPSFCHTCHKRTPFRSSSPDNCVVCGNKFKDPLEGVELEYCKYCQKQNPMKTMKGMVKCSVCDQVLHDHKVHPLPGTKRLSVDKQGKPGKGDSNTPPPQFREV